MARFRARPYAKALLEVVLEQCPERREQVTEQLTRVNQALTAVPDLHRVLVTPMVSVDTKTTILDQVLDSLAIDQPVRRFLHVVQHHYRMVHMPDILDAYRELVDRSLGRRRARVETATAIDAAQQRKLLAVFAGALKSKVIADFVENPELLAGFRVRVGSKVFDGSLNGQLNQLSRQTVIEQG